MESLSHLPITPKFESPTLCARKPSSAPSPTFDASRDGIDRHCVCVWSTVYVLGGGLERRTVEDGRRAFDCWVGGKGRDGGDVHAVRRG